MTRHWKGLVLAAIGMAAGMLGCGGGSGGSGGSGTATTPPGTVAPAPPSGSGVQISLPLASARSSSFVVRSITPRSAAQPRDLTEISLSFSNAIDPLSLIPYGKSGATVTVMQDRDYTWGGRYDLIDFTMRLEADHHQLVLELAERPDDGRYVLVVLSSGVIDSGGSSLEFGGASESLSADSTYFPDQVFESSFIPSYSGAFPTPTAPTFMVTEITPAHGAQVASSSEVRLRFSEPVDPTSLIQYPDAGYGFVVMQDRDQSLGGTHDLVAVTTRVEDGGRLVIMDIGTPLRDQHRALVIFTEAIRSSSGRSLQRGEASGALTAFSSFSQRQVFEASFTPGPVVVTPTPSNPPPPGNQPPPGNPPPPTTLVPDPDQFVTEAGTDPWFVDFEVRARSFQRDLYEHGFWSGDPSVDAPTKRRVEWGFLSNAGLKFRRTATGGRRPGRSLALSYTRLRPAGHPGYDFSRMAMGGSGGGVLGMAFFDWGNQDMEDNASSDMGVFPRGIWGREGWLHRDLTSADRRFVDGSYRLGDGSASDDSRFQTIRDAIADWSRGAGNVLAHETGHSVGLSHDDSEPNVMNGAAWIDLLSDPSIMFTDYDYRVLAQNLGVQR